MRTQWRCRVGRETHAQVQKSANTLAQNRFAKHAPTTTIFVVVKNPLDQTTRRAETDLMVGGRDFRTPGEGAVIFTKIRKKIIHVLKSGIFNHRKFIFTPKMKTFSSSEHRGRGVLDVALHDALFRDSQIARIFFGQHIRVHVFGKSKNIQVFFSTPRFLKKY